MQMMPGAPHPGNRSTCRICHDFWWHEGRELRDPTVTRKRLSRCVPGSLQQAVDNTLCDRRHDER